MPLVYTFRCRLSPESEAIAFAEVARGRALYNQMIAQHNPHPRQGALKICARNPQSASECYAGTHRAVTAAFQAATSAKRVGKFPGDPYRFRSRFELRGSKVGITWSKCAAPTWGKILAGFSTLISCIPGPKERRNYSEFALRVSREDPAIRFTSNIRRHIPPHAIVTAVYLVPDGEHGERHWWDLQITFDAQPEVRAEPITDRVGIDLGWAMLEDGSMVVAATSSGESLAIPAYAIRMADRVEELQSERDTLANKTKELLSERGIQCPSKSADGVTGWVESNGISGTEELIWLSRELRRRQQHVRRRFLGIRDELYRDFASSHRGAFILKTNLKPVAEVEIKGTESNHERTWASIFSLALLLRQREAIEVDCERRFNNMTPSIENAEEIRSNGESGKLVIRAARKPHRKFRKSLLSSGVGENAITTARLS